MPDRGSDAVGAHAPAALTTSGPRTRRRMLTPDCAVAFQPRNRPRLRGAPARPSDTALGDACVGAERVPAPSRARNDAARNSDPRPPAPAAELVATDQLFVGKAVQCEDPRPRRREDASSSSAFSADEHLAMAWRNPQPSVDPDRPMLSHSDIENTEIGTVSARWRASCRTPPALTPDACGPGIKSFQSSVTPTRASQMQRREQPWMPPPDDDDIAVSVHTRTTASARLRSRHGQARRARSVLTGGRRR